MAFGRRAGICHPCQHNGSGTGSPEMLPGNPWPPFFTAVELQQLQTEFLTCLMNCNNILVIKCALGGTAL